MDRKLLLLIVVMLVAVMASRYVFKRIRSRNFFYYQVLSILLVAGLALCINGRVSGELLSQTSPLMLLGMGWLGLYAGLFIGLQEIRKFNILVWKYAARDNLTVFAAYYLLSLPLLLHFHGNHWESYAAAAVLSLSALEVSPLAVSTLRNLNRGASSFGILLQSLSGMSGIFTIVFLGLASPLFFTGSLLVFSGEFLLQLIISIGMGLVAVYAVHDLRHSRDFLVWILAILLMTSGLATAFHYNAIFMNMITGMIISTFSPRRDAARKLLEPLEKPVFLLLLFFAGVSLRINWLFIGLAVVLMGIRMVLRIRIFRQFYGVHTANSPAVRTLAPAIIPFGNLSFTIGIYLVMLYPSQFSEMVLGALFFQYILSYTLASLVIRGGGQGTA